MHFDITPTNNNRYPIYIYNSDITFGINYIY